ncbi:hypothetical protein C8R44DRAFT_801570 [Mycena epipterygia]|nr:hypothetical protein C8R44DRAFT_801570 [Mycena epipterygia]
MHPPLPHTLLPLEEGSEPPRHHGEPTHRLPLPNVGDAFDWVCAAMHETRSDATLHSFHPTVETNVQWSGWSAMLGIRESVEIVLRTHALPRRDSQKVSQSALPQPRSPKTGSARSGQDDDVDSDGELEPVDDQRYPGTDDDDTMVVNTQELNAMLALWQKTHPVHLSTAARQSLLRHVQRYEAKNSSEAEIRVLCRFFSRRKAADVLAQKVADEIGIAHPTIRCEDFGEEVEIMPSYHGIHPPFIDWGELAPRDDACIDRLAHSYRKAAQWMFLSWTQSGQGIATLNQVLEQVKGGCF